MKSAKESLYKLILKICTVIFTALAVKKGFVASMSNFLSLEIQKNIDEYQISLLSQSYYSSDRLFQIEIYIELQGCGGNNENEWNSG
ncbi:hypothetical protein [Flavobacterium sp.]|uniref:hypothetical protein n=1 Tax=Flavobacterium sp. TaxID=239 RepID=UPI003265058D